MPRVSRPTSTSLRALALVAFGLTAALPAQSQDLAGPYLAARQADIGADFSRVTEYAPRALVADPDNLGLTEGLVVAYVATGDFDSAVPVARRLLGLDERNLIAGMVLLTRAAAAGEWDNVIAQLDAGASLGGVMDDILRAWAEFGAGRVSQALEIVGAGESGAPNPILRYQEALMLAQVGDFEGAEAILGDEDAPIGLNTSGIIARLQILSQVEDFEQALSIYDQVFGPTRNAELTELRAQLAAGAPIPFDAVQSPRAALSSMFLEVGRSLVPERTYVIALLYARLASQLDPGAAEPRMLAAETLELLGRYDLATRAYDSVPADDPAYVDAQMGKAEAERETDGNAAAVETLEALAAEYPDLAGLHISLGDSLRYDMRWEESAAAYSDAIALFDGDLQQQWIVYFTRGIAYERQNLWAEAEADFRKALELSPDQPQVLNYLGYSFVEQRTNLDEALDMIERAVEQRPNDGFITDSLGWAFYRLGRYEEAVVQMERAVELEPVDPILNDHLGDTYWAVGRTREARFQWRRALSFVSDDTDLDELNPDRIRQKLEVGLDRVLEEEGGDPIAYDNATDR